MKNSFRSLIVCALVLAVGVSTVAPSVAIAASQQEVSPKPGGPRRQLATILFAGLGGAVLGLSTLSFYGRPQDKLSNIAIGFAFGVIAGTTYVTYKAATGPSEFYGLTHPQLEQDEAVWNKTKTAPESTPLSLAYSFEF